MSNCKDCVHSIYDEVWGECKCKVHGHRIYNRTEFADCAFYRRVQTKKDSKKGRKRA